MTCEEVRISLGAHALGALDPEEAAEIDHHLATCEACGAELLELEGVGAFLGKVSERDVELVASPPRQVLDRLLNDRVKRTRRGRALMSLVAAAAVLVVGGTVWTAVQTGSGGGSTAAQAPAASQGPEVMRDQSSAEKAVPQSSPRASQSAAEDARSAVEPSASPAPGSRPAQGRPGRTRSRSPARTRPPITTPPCSSGRRPRAPSSACRSPGCRWAPTAWSSWSAWTAGRSARTAGSCGARTTRPGRSSASVRSSA
ncbi:zf-HC2 domain-containing protein [Nonomuraea thailandensis]